MNIVIGGMTGGAGQTGIVTKGYGGTYIAPPAPPLVEPSAGQVELIRAYRRIPFKTQILLTANIHKKFIEKLILSASLIHRFKEILIIKVAAVKLFEEKLCLIGGLNVMDWIYDKFEEFIADDEDERLTE